MAGTSSPEAGEAAPDFEKTDQEGNTHRLSDYRGQWVVLYFYPKDNTPGCTREACAFRDRRAELEKRGAKVLGVSPDSAKSHARFAEKQGLSFPLLADPEKEVLDAYGVWREKTSFGKTSLGVVRTTFLIDPDGNIAHVWDKVKVDGHDETVLTKLDELA